MTLERHGQNHHMKHLQTNRTNIILHQARNSAFPVILISIIGTALLLASYYIFVLKRCSKKPTHEDEEDDDSFIALSPATWNRGLDKSAILKIPSFQFNDGKESLNNNNNNNSEYCAVCLSEFQSRDTLRALPSCDHAFHSDCIDAWLQSNANCPLCRTAIADVTNIDPLAAPSSSPREFQAVYSDIGSDEDFVVIELGIGGGGEEEMGMAMARNDDREEGEEDHEKRIVVNNKKKCHHVSIMGDEGIIDHRLGGGFQPMRRSFSWDSAVDWQLYTTVNEIASQNKNSSNDDLLSKSFFPFRPSKGGPRIFPFEI